LHLSHAGLFSFFLSPEIEAKIVRDLGLRSICAVFVVLVIGCKPVEPQSLTFEECRDLQSVVEERDKYGIFAASDQADRASLQRCPYKARLAGAAPQNHPNSSYVPSAPIAASSSPVTDGDEISLVMSGGVLAVPVLINQSVLIPFIIDSGAADVQLPAEVVLTLFRTGTISDEDFLGGSSYVLANGSRLRSPRFNIREMRVGKHVVRNVVASTGPAAKSQALLGQSFLSRLGSWTLDNRRGVLILTN
jgi:predicted aspartyl protease